jgi:hypothetical protein
MFLAFEILFIILIRNLRQYWPCSSKIERLRDGLALLLLITMGFAWHTVNETEIKKQETHNINLGEYTGRGDPPIYIGWPNQHASFTVLEPSNSTANSPEIVVTRLRHGDEAPIIVFHKDEGLRPGDLVLTSSDGRISIRRVSQPQIADKQTSSQQSGF